MWKGQRGQILIHNCRPDPNHRLKGDLDTESEDPVGGTLAKKTGLDARDRGHLVEHGKKSSQVPSRGDDRHATIETDELWGLVSDPRPQGAG